MRTHVVRRGASNTTTIVIIVVVVLVSLLLVLGCIGAILSMIMLPAIGQARERAMEIRSTAQLLQIDMAYGIWLRDAEPDGPFTFDALLEGNYATAELFRSTFGPVPDGGEDYWWLHPKPGRDEEGAAEAIVGYDRAMYATHNRVAVLFGDGNTDILDTAEFERRLRSPPNDEVDFNLPQRGP